MSVNSHASMLKYEKSGSYYFAGYLLGVLGAMIIGVDLFAVVPGVAPIFQMILLAAAAFLLVVAKVNLDEGCAIDNRNKMRQMDRELHPDLWAGRGAN